jgi:hypothetical protein
MNVDGKKITPLFSLASNRNSVLLAKMNIGNNVIYGPTLQNVCKLKKISLTTINLA